MEVVPKLTKEQRDWVDSKLEGKEILYAGIHGSWLYGLATETSDIDIKAVYLPSKTDLIRGHAIKTHNYKNDELDIEIEVKSVSSFLRSCASCDTNCIDLLHAPEEFSLRTTYLWHSLKSYRKGLYAKNMRGIVGYIKTHSKKYTNKIDRLNEMKSVLAYTKGNMFNKTVGDVSCEMLEVDKHKFKYVKVVKSNVLSDGHQEYLEVCGKKYCLTWDVFKLRTAMGTEISRYGERSNKGADKGIDSKSLSHALRVLLQLKEIITTEDLTFPLKGATYIKAVKRGEVVDVLEVLDKIDALYEECMTLLEASDFKDEVDISEMETLVEDYYF